MLAAIESLYVGMCEIDFYILRRSHTSSSSSQRPDTHLVFRAISKLFSFTCFTCETCFAVSPVYAQKKIVRQQNEKYENLPRNKPVNVIIHRIFHLFV